MLFPYSYPRQVQSIFLRGRMKNITVFAHYDRNNLIDDYVIYYLNELKNVSEALIFVSDSDLPETELLKIKNIVDYTLAIRHGEYDFGSYKRGWKIAVDQGLLADADVLTFANDSCIGPFSPLSQLYEEMNSQECDFWGFTSNENEFEKKYFLCPEANNRHIQSYFFVAKNNVFNSDVFNNFRRDIKKEKDKFNIIEKYEIGLSSTLVKAGYKFKSLSDEQIGVLNLEDIINLEKESPFILMKVSVLREFYFIFLLRLWFKKVKNYSEYPLEVITKYLKRIREIKYIKLVYIRKKIIRLHISERKVFLFGKWINYGK